MQRFLIEIPHEADPLACTIAVRALMETGSHLLTNADYGCRDNVHKGWLTVEAESRDEARLIVPPAYRAKANIISLNRFSLEELDELFAKHGGRPATP